MLQVNLLYNNFASIFINKEETKHLKERNERINIYEKYNLLSYNFVSCFKVDKDHKNGLEIHAINENGLIYVYNFKSRKLITILNARSDQIKRYYNALKIEIPNTVKNIMIEVDKRNKTQKLNFM